MPGGLSEKILAEMEKNPKAMAAWRRLREGKGDITDIVLVMRYIPEVNRKKANRKAG